MDGSRTQDLYLLKQRMQDESLSEAKRRQAAQKFYDIRQQAADTQLTELRQRLVRATQAADHEAIEQLGNEITRYSYEKGYKH
jgi:hypothetical protein